MEAVELVGRKDKNCAGNQVNRLVEKPANASALDDAPHPHRRVRVRGLIDAWRDVEVVETGVAFDRRRDQKRIGTTVDGFQATQLLDRSAPCREPPIRLSNADKTLQ